MIRLRFRHQTICLTLGLMVNCAGCMENQAGIDRRDSIAVANSLLIAGNDRHYDFGNLITRSSQKLMHKYRLRNLTKQNVQIVWIVNRKSCCGRFRIGTYSLQPGQATDLEIELIVGEKLGNIVNEIEIVTNLSVDPTFVLRTYANAWPAFRIEETSPPEDAISSEARESRRVGYRILATGTSTDPPFDLNRIEFESPITVEWTGPKTQRHSDDGLDVWARDFTVIVDGSGLPGNRKAEVLFKADDHFICRHTMNWQVIAPISISPKVIVLRRTKNTLHVVIQAAINKGFRITHIECGMMGIQGSVVSIGGTPTQIIEFEGLPTSQDKRGVAIVYTDHPDQPKIELPFIVID